MENRHQEIAEALRSALDNEEPVVLSPFGKPISFFCSILDMNESFVTLKNPIHPDFIPYIVTAKNFALHCRSHRLEAQSLLPVGTKICFPFNPSATKAAVRQNVRTSFFKEEDAFVRIEHPFDKGTVFTRPLYDYSNEGMSFRARLPTPFLQPGREIPSCRVFIQGKFHAEKSGRIVYVKQIVDLNGQSFYQVGVQFVDSKSS